MGLLFPSLHGPGWGKLQGYNLHQEPRLGGGSDRGNDDGKGKEPKNRARATIASLSGPA